VGAEESGGQPSRTQKRGDGMAGSARPGQGLFLTLTTDRLPRLRGTRTSDFDDEQWENLGGGPRDSSSVSPSRGFVHAYAGGVPKPICSTRFTAQASILDEYQGVVLHLPTWT